MTGEPRLEYGNVRNDGLIDDCRTGAASRCPAGSTRTAYIRSPSAQLPPQCAALNRTFVNVVELTVRAALEERRDHIYHAVMLDPNAAATLTISRGAADGG